MKSGPHRGTPPVFLTVALSAAVLFSASHAAAAPLSSEASCREAANGLVSLLDAKRDNTLLYRDTYAVVVNTCGPAAAAPRPATPPSPSGRTQCHDLAAAMVDLIEDEKMDSAAFVRVGDAFAAACAPK